MGFLKEGVLIKVVPKGSDIIVLSGQVKVVGVGVNLIVGSHHQRLPLPAVTPQHQPSHRHLLAGFRVGQHRETAPLPQKVQRRCPVRAWGNGWTSCAGLELGGVCLRLRVRGRIRAGHRFWSKWVYVYTSQHQTQLVDAAQPRKRETSGQNSASRIAFARSYSAGSNPVLTRVGGTGGDPGDR